MTSLRKILFAGTLVPAIALTPLGAASAQAPDQERGAPGGHPEHGPRGPGEGTRGVGATPPAGAQQRSRAADAEERGTGTRGAAHPTERNASRGTSDRATAAQERGAGQLGAGQLGATAQERRQAATRAAPNGAAGEHGARRDAAGATGTRPTGSAERTGAPAREAPVSGTAAQEPRHNTTRDTATGVDPTPSPGRAARDDRHALPGLSQPDRGTANRGVPGHDPRDNADRGTPDRGARDASRNDRGPGPGGAAAIGAAAGFAGGFLAATAGAQRLDDIRRDRREVTEDGRTYIREPGRTIVEEDGRTFIVHDENDRFRELGYDVRRERRGSDDVDVVDRPGGVQILTYTDASGRMLRRIRRGPDGREVVLIDNGVDGRIRPYDEDVVDLPPPPMRIARDRYVVDYADADEGTIYDTLIAPPLAPPPQRYTLDQIRYSPTVRSYVRSVDINTINFDTGSWVVPGAATGKLQALATAIRKAVDRNPTSVFLVEGYTDATGNANDNLSLSDRRAQSVAAILTKSFDVPPENLTTQGYGQQNLKVNTQGPSLENRRVVVQNITQLLASNDRRPSSGE